MSSIEIARAVLTGMQPERRVSVQWHKGETYTCTVIQRADDLIYDEVREVYRGGDRMAALRAYIRLVDQYWSRPV